MDYRYLWAIGKGTAQIPVDSIVAERYLVKSSQIWLDLKPGTQPPVPDVLPPATLPYLHLHPYRLHVPELHGIYREDTVAIWLLDNVPITKIGQLLPALEDAWATVSPVRQVYWLWQWLQLWKPLKDYGVATSLLVSDNLHVEGWRLRLRQLLAEQANLPRRTQPQPSEAVDLESPPTLPPTFIPEQPSPSVSALGAYPPFLKDLAESWLPLVERAHPVIQEPLQALCQQMQATDNTEAGLKTIATQLNRLLLEQAAQLPLWMQVAGKTDTGRQRAHNEDACHPCLQSSNEEMEDLLSPHFGIICDGIGGHEGGEVASQRALDDLKRLIQNLLSDLQAETEPLLPGEIEQQLESIVRIVNNVIAQQNDDQKRELRQRMGTTLVMALQLPQRIATPVGLNNAHELYLVHVGDSRAYWLTPDYCYQLTVDDDVATREVRLGHSLYQDALGRPDSGALTQAIGTRSADALHPTIQRFIIEENGILLLCSDGLSDNNRVEQTWEPFTRAVLEGTMSLQEAVQSWIEVANQRNGHDNTSVVLMQFQVSRAPKLPKTETEIGADFTADIWQTDTPSGAEPSEPEELTEASRALLYEEEDQAAPDFSGESAIPPEVDSPKPPGLLLWLVGLVTVAFIAGAIGFIVWNQVSTDSNPPNALPSAPTVE
ncbi:MAG: protein phosphatase 2C domain-containing protein [Elainellaceae cyanobacterium]